MLHHIIIFVCSLLMIVSGIAMYVKGETDTKWLGKASQGFKTMMGIPMGLLWAIAGHPWAGLITMGTYAIAAVAFGYGTNNPWTKWFGKDAAVIITGAAFGLASVPILGLVAILQSLIAGWAWGVIHTLDDSGKVKEPRVAIYRAIGALCLILFLSLVR